MNEPIEVSFNVSWEDIANALRKRNELLERVAGAARDCISVGENGLVYFRSDGWSEYLYDALVALDETKGEEKGETR